MRAMPEDDCRAVIPAVERVARLARIASELLGGRLPLVDRDRRNDRREFERDRPPRLFLAVNIGPLGADQLILVRFTDLDRAPRPVAPAVAALKAAVVRELRQM